MWKGRSWKGKLSLRTEPRTMDIIKQGAPPFLGEKPLIPPSQWDFSVVTTQRLWHASHFYHQQTRAFIETIQALFYHCLSGVGRWIRRAITCIFSYRSLDHQEPYLDLMQISCIIPDLRLPDLRLTLCWLLWLDGIGVVSLRRSDRMYFTWRKERGAKFW